MRQRDHAWRRLSRRHQQGDGHRISEVKIVVDVSLVLLGIVFCYTFFGKWQWHIIGVGTLFAMYYVGWAVRIASHHLNGSTVCLSTVRDSGDTSTDWQDIFTEVGTRRISSVTSAGLSFNN